MHNLTLCSLAEISFASSDAYNIVYCIRFYCAASRLEYRQKGNAAAHAGNLCLFYRKQGGKGNNNTSNTNQKYKKKREAFYIHGIGPISLAHRRQSIRFLFFLF